MEEEEITDVEFTEEDATGVIGKNKSPIPAEVETSKKRETLNFYDALKEVEVGAKISKLEWNNLLIFGFMKDYKLCLHKEDGSVHNWILSDGDLGGEDWVIL